MKLFLPALLALIPAASAAAQSCPGDDGYSPNHTCGTATFLGSTISLTDIDMVATDDRFDYFRIFRDVGSELYVRIEFDSAEGDLDLHLYRDDQCDVGPALESSTGTGNVEVIEYQSDFDTILRVSRQGGPGDCSEYKLWIMQERNSTLGGNICAGGTNSTGWTAPLSAFGSLDTSANDLSLAVSFLPLNSFGFFLNSRGAGFLMPAGSEGFLCINSGGIGRFIRPGELQNSGPLGSVSLDLDLTSIPRPTSTVSAIAGDSYSFQYWYRDVSSAGQPVSNFSGAVMVWLE